MTERAGLHMPTALRRTQAAFHCGISATTFDGMVRDGRLPPPRVLKGINIWLRQELDEALFALPTLGGQEAADPCSAIFAA